MKNHLFKLMLLLLAMAVISCGKSNPSNPTPTEPTNPTGGVTNGNTTDYKGYVVKTIGVNMMMLGVDENYKLTNAYLYGGGNKIILKAGTGNKAEFLYSGIATCPDAIINRPDGTIRYGKVGIDNGKMLDTTGGATVIKLKGFDKSKTGYNQLNVVFCDFLWSSYITSGYYNNIIFTKFKEQAGKKNSDYGSNEFISSVFGGNINVASVEMAPPVSDKTYITEDQVMAWAQASYKPSKDSTYNFDLISPFFRVYNSNSKGFELSPIAIGLKYEWVNANNGTVSSTEDQYTFEAKFNNMLAGGRDQFPLPSDTTSKVFLRVKGFDRNVFGFNQLRLFIANDDTYKGKIQVIFGEVPNTKPTLETMKKVFSQRKLYCLLASPVWPHY